MDDNVELIDLFSGVATSRDSGGKRGTSLVAPGTAVVAVSPTCLLDSSEALEFLRSLAR